MCISDSIDIDAEVGGNRVAHRLRMWADLRPLADHGDVAVADAPATFTDEPVAMAHECAAVGALPARVRGREMDADVAQRQRAEQSIAQGMQCHVAVAVRQHAAIVGNADAPEHHVVAIAERVHVEAVALSLIHI